MAAEQLVKINKLLYWHWLLRAVYGEGWE